MNGEKVLLTADQAIAMLDPEAEEIHTFRNPGSILVGADWNREELMEAIHKALVCEIGGEMCCGLNHGLVVWTEERHPLYVECHEGMDYEAYAKGLRTTEPVELKGADA